VHRLPARVVVSPPTHEATAAPAPSGTSAEVALLPARPPADVPPPSASPPNPSRVMRHGPAQQRAPRAPAARPSPVAATADAGSKPLDPNCRVEQYADTDGFVRFRCAR
jgi:hypothetical protein